jgi:hypothetical protein
MPALQSPNGQGFSKVCPISVACGLTAPHTRESAATLKTDVALEKRGAPRRTTQRMIVENALVKDMKKSLYVLD